MENLVASFLENAIKLSDNNYFNVFVTYAQPNSRVLDLIYRNEDDVIKPSIISDVLNLSRVTVTVSLNNLEKEGLVERKLSNSDRRNIIVNITKKGREKVEEVRTIAYNFLEDMFKTIGEEKTKDLVEIIDVLCKEKLK